MRVASAAVARARVRRVPHRRAGTPRGASVFRGRPLGALSGAAARRGRSRTLRIASRQERSARRRGLAQRRGSARLYSLSGRLPGSIPSGSARWQRQRGEFTRRFWSRHEPVGSEALVPHRSGRAGWLECCTSDIAPHHRQLTLDEVRLNEESIAFARLVISSRRLPAPRASLRGPAGGLAPVPAPKDAPSPRGAVAAEEISRTRLGPSTRWIGPQGEKTINEIDATRSKHQD